MPRTKMDIDTGKVYLKRGNAFANNHNPMVSAVGRCNQDIQATFISGLESLKSMYYMTSYVMKHEDDYSDALVMEAAWEQLESEGVLRTGNDLEKSHRLMLRMNYIRQSGTQFSGAKIAAMILNIGQKGMHYTDSKFGYVNLEYFVKFIQNGNEDCRIVLRGEHFTNLNCNDQEERDADLNDEIPEGEDNDYLEDGEQSDTDDDVVDIEMGNSNGIPGMVEDYIFRGNELEDMSLYEMVMMTQVVDGNEKQFERYRESLNGHRRRGRPWNKKIFLLLQHSEATSQWISFRSEPCVPCVYGKGDFELSDARTSDSS